MQMTGMLMKEQNNAEHNVILLNIYIAPFQGTPRGALSTGLCDVRCRYERMFSVSSKD